MDPRLQATNALANQARKLVDSFKASTAPLSGEQCLDLQLAIDRLGDQIDFLRTELGEMRTRSLK